MANNDTADAEAIGAFAKQANDAFSARDLPAFIDFFDEDVVAMPPDRDPIIGRDAWQSWLESWWDRVSFASATATSDEIHVMGDWAFERHSEETTSDLPDGTQRQSRNKGIWMLRRQDDGSWRIARYIWNANPVPEATA